MAKNRMMSYSSDAPKGKDVRSTNMLDTTAREKHATGTNSVKRETVKHKPFGDLGAKGHP